MATPRNDWERLVESLIGLVVGNESEEDHYATCQRLLRAEKLLKRVAPDELKAARVVAKAEEKA